jgi:uncharacterized Zn finger protein
MAMKGRGGIKAVSKRGAFGERWWAKRWIAVLESFGLGPRLSRGRSYARNGRVTQIAIEPDGVRAKVQGSRKAPYGVSIALKPLDPAQWGHVTQAIAQSPRFAAMLLGGQMPEDIEDAFRAAKCELFPASITDVRAECSCPDWSNPCKHVAAVYYLIGEEFDRDPFLIFALRGRARDAVLSELAIDKAEKANAPAVRDGTATRPPVERPPMDAWLLRQAGHFPFWHGSIALEDALSRVYADAAEEAATLLAETWPDR